MTWAIPRATVQAMRRGDEGIVVWALQKALGALKGWSVAADGRYGPNTEAAVKALQNAEKLTTDGIAGPMTQRALILRHIRVVEATEALPAGLLEGFAQGEGNFLLGAVNWSVPGGVDCGTFQRRVFVEDFDDSAVIERAFDVAYQARLVAQRLVELRGIFIARAGTNDGTVAPREKAWRLAVLNHNYPTAADRFSRTPIAQLDPYWTTTQAWVVTATTYKRADGTTYRLKFPDGTVVNTPLQWSHLYAGILGAEEYGWPGSITRQVTDWTPV